MNTRSLNENQNLAQVQANCPHNLLTHQNIQIQPLKGKPYPDEFYVCAHCSKIISPIPPRIDSTLSEISTSLANLNRAYSGLIEVLKKLNK